MSYAIAIRYGAGRHSLMVDFDRFPGFMLVCHHVLLFS